MNLRISVAVVTTLAAAFGALTASQPNPIEAARLNNLGAAYMNQQLFEKALKLFQQATEADPNLAIARLNVGIAYLNLQKVDEAKAALDGAAKQDPKNPTAWYNLGILGKNSGDADAAIAAFNHVIDIDAADADTWYFLGSSYVQAKQYPQAIDAFEHALKINPIHASAEFGLSRAYQQSGDVDHAREHLKKFQYLTQNKISTPMSLAYGEQGQYSRVVESPQGQIKPPAQIKVQFVDVTAEAGVASKPSGAADLNLNQRLGPGACFLDYDNDGKVDIFVADDGAQGGTSLYHNLGSGKFQDVTKQAGLDSSVHAISCTSGDYDNDGFVDLAVGQANGLELLHNEKNGTFKNVNDAAGIRPSASVIGLAFVDYDHDGDLDIYASGDAPVCRGLGCGSAVVWRNNGNGSFTSVDIGVSSGVLTTGAIGTDYNNDRAVDLLVADMQGGTIFQNPREGKFLPLHPFTSADTSKPDHAFQGSVGVTALDFDHDGWMDVALTRWKSGIILWRNNHGKSFEQVKLPETDLAHAFGIAAFDYDNDGWVDFVAVGETKDGKGEIKLFRNLGPDGFKDVTTDVGLDKIHLESPRAIITGDYDNDGTVDLLITQNHGPAVLLRNEGGNKNHWLRLALKGLADNKSAIGTKVEVFFGGNRQKFEIYGSNGYLGQNSPYLTVGLGDAKEADIVRMLWPTGVLQDEIQIAGDQQKDLMEIDRRGSSCPTLFAWNGERYQFVADMLGAGVVGHWIGPGQRDVPRPVEWIKLPTGMIHEKENLIAACHPERSEGPMHSRASCIDPSPQKTAAQDDKAVRTTDDRRPTTVLSFRFMEPLEEAVYLDQVRLLAVDHPADTEVYPNEYFASNPPYPEFKVVVSNNKDARQPAGAWDEHGHDVLSDLLAHRYFGDFELTPFAGFAKTHTLTLDLGEAYRGGPLWLLLHGEVEYFSANSMYAASQSGLVATSPYIEVLGEDGTWKRVIDDMGFPAGGPRTMTADLTGKLPVGTQKIRITTNLQVYWDGILIDRTEQPVHGQRIEDPSNRAKNALARDDKTSGREPHLNSVPLVRADLEFHGYPLKIEGKPAGNVQYVYDKASATGPYTRPVGTYTRYGDVLPLLTTTDDKLAVFGSGDEVQLDFDPSKLPALPAGWVRDYFFAANGYEKDMDFYAAEGNYVAPLPFLSMGEYPYEAKKSFPLDDAHLNYLLEYNTRNMSGNEQRGYAFDYGEQK